MIYVNGVRFPSDSSSVEGLDMVNALLEHPHLVSASQSFRAVPERKFSVSEESGSQGSAEPTCVYVFQREYAIADPALVEIVGTDEATTCVGIVVRNCKNGMTSIAHMDSPDVVDIGLSQMLSLVPDHDDAILDVLFYILVSLKSFDFSFDGLNLLIKICTAMQVHLVGAFDDSATQVWSNQPLLAFELKDGNDDTRSKQHSEMEGYSFQLCIKIVEKLAESKVNFQIQNFQVLKNNTRWDSEGNANPIFHGLAVETSCGSVVPASFDRSTRCPDEIIRRIRLGASFKDPGCTGRSMDVVHIAMMMRHYSDTEILVVASTSPSAEGPDFVHNHKRIWQYLIQHPDWRETFRSKLPRVFERIASGNWVMTSDR
ncbi:Protein N-terminal asparagine amidohydrolase [Cynara cardunculus var. scolymus]|uniref:Protein N-terminal asparagine amidohydrolase n=1 Tax=Cynara cardunculus var. scolymus TaxID=59895 RepID=A0A103Y184_CYNCS|nr:Protein N-terminal asparagine amidohydrolase [Cynara cardunculus var. scolymus]